MTAWTTKLVWSDLVSAAAVAEMCAGSQCETEWTTVGNAPPDIARMRRAQRWLSLLAPEDRDLLLGASQENALEADLLDVPG
jgi:hypothetical protein